MRFWLSPIVAFALLLAFLPACHMPALPSEAPPDEEGLWLKNVRLYSAQGNQLQLFGQLAEVRFYAEQRLLTSTRANLLWVLEGLQFQAEHLHARMDTQEAWAPEYWQFQTQDDSFGEGTAAYGHKDGLGHMYAQTQKPLRLWQNENTLEAKAAHCEAKTKNCEFLGAVKTNLSKAE